MRPTPAVAEGAGETEGTMRRHGHDTNVAVGASKLEEPAHNSPEGYGNRRPGTVLAWPGVRWLLPLLLCWSVSACLVTEDVDYSPEPNWPPSIESQPGAQHPLREMVVVDLDAPPDGGLSDLPLEVEVRDPNVDDELQAKVFVDDGTNATVRAPVPPSGSPVRRLTIAVPLQGPLLVLGCHRVELRVTRRFRFVPPQEPEEPGDLGTAVWWVVTRDDTQRTFDPSSCPK